MQAAFSETGSWKSNYPITECPVPSAMRAIWLAVKCVHALSAERASSLSGVRAASSSGLRGSNAPAKVGNNLLILAGMNNKHSIHKAFLDGLVPARLKVIWIHLWVWWVNVYVCRKEQLFSSGKLKRSVYCFGNIFDPKSFSHTYDIPGTNICCIYKTTGIVQSKIKVITKADPNI